MFCELQRILKNVISPLQLYAVFIAMVMLLCFPTLKVHAATTSDGYVYTVSGNTATITGYSGMGGDISIPADIDG
jgi:hypothetical protein